MPSAQISSYTASAGRLGQLGSDRMLVLRHVVTDDAASTTESTSEVFFADRFGETELGFTTLGTRTEVRAHLPTADFEVWLDLLRHEKPVYLHWTISDDEGVPEADGIVHIGTGPEPPGEGPVDLSP